MMSNREDAQIIVAELVSECRDRLDLLEDIVRKSQNGPPHGMGDDSIDSEDWGKLKAVEEAVGTIVNAMDSFIPKRDGMPPDPVDTFKATLHHRAERLAKLVELNAPLPVITQAVELVFKAGCCLDPDGLGTALGNRIARASRPNHGYCSNTDCPNPIEGKREPPMCGSCLSDIIAANDEYVDPHGETFE